MKINGIITVALLGFSTLYLQLSTAFAQGTAFTYQGRLSEGANPANGVYDLRFRLASDALGNNFVGSSVLTNGVTVSEGLFAVTLNFGGGIFTGSNLWLQVDVRTNGGGSYTTLTPLQALTPSPYAIMAGSASNLLGRLSAAQLSGTYTGAVTFNNASNIFTGNGAGLTGVNAGTLNGLASSNFWRTTGNAGTTAGTHFLGTTDNQPLELQVNGLRALRVEFGGDSSGDSDSDPDGAPNVIWGAPINFVGPGVVGATISGGGATNYFFSAYTNSVLSDFGVVGGGGFNHIADHSSFATIAGGNGNQIGVNSTFGGIGGGVVNHVLSNSPYAAIAGGGFNLIGTNSQFSTIGGGRENIAANSSYATIAGGFGNRITNSYLSAIGGGGGNDIGINSPYSTIGGGQGNRIMADSFAASIAGGNFNSVGTNSFAASIAGGDFNRIDANSSSSAIGGGENNIIAANSQFAAIAGGSGNFIGTNSYLSAIGGGGNNTIASNAMWATIPGGFANSATNYAFAAGNRAKANHTGAFVWADSTDVDFVSTDTNQFLIRASGGVGIGTTAPEGDLHVFRGSAGAVTASSGAPLVIESDTGAFIHMLTPGNALSGILFGSPLGFADASIRYNNSGADRELSFRTLNNQKMVITTNGNVGIGVSNPTNRLHVNGGITCTALVQTSDRSAKENFAPVSSSEVLAKVAALPITTWTFKELHDGRHIGPMAQDFYAAFHLGGSDTTITSLDTDGVAFAAIQGLNQKLEAENKEIRSALHSRDAALAELKERLTVIEEVLRQVARVKD